MSRYHFTTSTANAQATIQNKMNTRQILIQAQESGELETREQFNNYTDDETIEKLAVLWAKRGMFMSIVELARMKEFQRQLNSVREVDYTEAMKRVESIAEGLNDE